MKHKLKQILIFPLAVLMYLLFKVKFLKYEEDADTGWDSKAKR